jgi:HEAT repeat protein
MRRVWLVWLGIVCAMACVAVGWRWRGRAVAVGRVAQRLADPERAVRLDAAVALRRVRAPESAPAMVARLPVEPDAEVRQALCLALVASETPEATAALRGRLADPARDVRLETVRALGLVAAPGAVPLLAERLPAEPEPALREALCVSLARAGTHAAARALTQGLDDPSPAVADRARRALETLYRRPLPADAAAARAAVDAAPPPP